MAPHITKSKISDIRQLHQKKHREERQLFIVEGVKSVLELYKSDLIIKELFASSEWLTEHENDISQETSVFITNRPEMERISTLKSPQEVLAVVKAPQYGIKEIRNDTPLLVLDDIRDPGNLGTMIRTADWFGFRQILCSPECVEFTNPKTIQASMGSFGRVKVIYENIPQFLSKHTEGRRILGTFMTGVTLSDIHFLKNDIIIIGNEARGISEKITPFINQKITIPTFPENSTESLNAAIATAIVLYQYNNSMGRL